MMEMNRKVGPIVIALGLAACSGETEGPTLEGPIVPIAMHGATNPTVAVGPDGRGYVAWVGSEDGVYDVYLAMAEDGGQSFTTPVRVNDVPGDAAPHEQAPAQVAVGSGGEIYVLWQNNTPIEGRRFPASDLRLAVSRDGGQSFLPAVTVNDDAGEVPTSHTFHDLTVAPDGSLLVSWIDSRTQEEGAEGHAGHSMEGLDAVGPEIRMARSIDHGMTFSASAVVDVGSCPCCRTAIAIGPDGATYISWRKIFEGDVRDIVVARADPGSMEFGEPVRVHADDWVFPGCPHAGPALEVDSDGRVHVAWYTGQEERQGLWYASSDDGARSFSPALPVLTDEWVPPSQVVLAPTDRGVWIGWEDRTVQPSMIRFGPVDRLAASRTMNASAVHGRLPSMETSGTVTLLSWLDGESVHARWVGMPSGAP